MEPDDVARRLSDLDDNFKKAPSEGGNFGNDLPDLGDYQALFTGVFFFEKKDPPHNAFLKLVFEVQDDAMYAGWEIPMIYNLEPHKVPHGQPTPTAEAIEQKLSFLKRDLKTMGIDVDSEDFSFAQVRPGSSIWDDPLDSPFLIAVRDSKKLNPSTGQPYRNAYLNERLGGKIPPDIPVDTDYPEPTLEQVGGGTPEDDIPFGPSMI